MYISMNWIRDFVDLDGEGFFIGTIIDKGEYFFGHPFGTAVAVTYRVTKQIAVLVDESEIHSPSIDADALYLIAFLCGFFQPVLHVLEEGGEVPIHMLAQFHLTVAETVHFFQFKFAVGDMAGHYTTTASAEVNG